MHLYKFFFISLFSLFNLIYCHENLGFNNLNSLESLHPLSPSLTNAYLQDHPIVHIKNVLHFKSVMTAPEFDKNLPLVNQIIVFEEQNTGLIGYHGASQNYRIFQDILRSVFEEVLLYPIPNDFQFLRIPGEEMFDLKNGKVSFFSLFDRKLASQEFKKKIIDSFLLKPFNKIYGVSPLEIQITDITTTQLNNLWGIVFEFIEILDSLAKADYENFEFGDEKFLISLEIGSTFQNPHMKEIHKRIQSILLSLESDELDGQLQSLVPDPAQKSMADIFMKVLKKKNKNKEVNSSTIKNM